MPLEHKKPEKANILPGIGGCVNRFLDVIYSRILEYNL